MSETGRETEAKFYVLDLQAIERRLKALGADLIQPRVFERNIRFDLPGGRLRSEGRVLRLRSDAAARITYKGPSTSEEGVLSRVEIEFEVGDFEKARQLLEALGYEKLVYYEKYRSIHELHGVLVMMDELPYGDFVEIEGESLDTIRRISDLLSFNWETSIGTSYNALFDRARKSLQGPFKDLSFKDFKGVHVRPEHLGVRPADT